MNEKEIVLVNEENTESVEVSNTYSETVVSDDFQAIATSCNAVGYLDSIDNSLTVIMMVMVVWFCMWNMRSWRTWSVKLRGRK